RIPLFPPGVIFQSTVSSKFPNCRVVIKDPPLSSVPSPKPSPLHTIIPSSTTHSGPISSALYRFQPSSDFPSNSNSQPAAASASVNVLSAGAAAVVLASLSAALSEPDRVHDVTPANARAIQR